MIKFCLVLCVFAFAKLSSADLFSDVAKEQWNSFKADYNKEYENKIEESFRFKVYMTNMKRILEHNRRYKAGNETYSMKMNQFGDLFEHEIIGTMMGLNYTLMKEELSKSNGINYVPPANVKLPTYVNWAEQGAVTPVKNQGQCGSCWAFSSTGSLEGQHFRATKQLISLSEQNLVDCSGSYGNNGCGGGWMTTSFSYIKDNNGIDTEQGYAYEARDGPCRFNKNSVGATDKGFISIPAGNEDMLMSAVATVGPISVALDASMFSFYHEGIFFDPNCFVSYRLNHGVLVVGYGKETIQGKEIDYWIIKNSWGTSWGMQGYMKMLKYQNMCHIADAASYPVV